MRRRPVGEAPYDLSLEQQVPTLVGEDLGSSRRAVPRKPRGRWPSSAVRVSSAASQARLWPSAVYGVGAVEGQVADERDPMAAVTSASR